MMSNLLKALEWLARYGIIDIAFGLGLSSIILSAFRRRKVREIDGVEIYAELSHDPLVSHKSKLLFRIENHSGQPLYVFRALFRPKRAFLWKPVVLKLSPMVRITPSGWYLPFVDDPQGEFVQLPQYLKPGEKRALFITLDNEEYSQDLDKQQELENLRIKRSCGTLVICCIRGTEEKTLWTRI